jgi:hypothetical protein
MKKHIGHRVWAADEAEGALGLPAGDLPCLLHVK